MFRKAKKRLKRKQAEKYPLDMDDTARNTYEPVHDISFNVEFATSKASD